jgi:hypothetical protein
MYWQRLVVYDPAAGEWLAAGLSCAAAPRSALAK